MLCLFRLSISQLMEFCLSSSDSSMEPPTPSSHRLDLQICFPTGESQNLTFYIILLDQSCTIVLGYHLLTCYNPSIDWVLGSIFFWQPSQHESKSSPSVETLPSSAPFPNPPDSVPEP